MIYNSYMHTDGYLPNDVEGVAKIDLFKNKFGLPPDHKLPEDTVRVLKKIDSSNPTIRPVVDKSPTSSQKERWKSQFLALFSDKETADRIADTLLKSINRIDEVQFEENLLKSFNQAAQKIRQEDLSKAGFIYYSGGKIRSNQWVREIARDYLPDDEILSLPMLDYHDENIAASKEVGIIMDDASYSGQQITDHIRRGYERYGMKRFYVIVPFMTEKAIKDVEALSLEMGINIQMYIQQTIPTLDQILGERDFKWLKQVSPTYRLTNEHTTTYFAHKVPDYRSFCPYIGETRYVEVSNYLDSLIEQKPAPYHPEYFSDLKERGLLK